MDDITGILFFSEAAGQPNPWSRPGFRALSSTLLQDPFWKGESRLLDRFLSTVHETWICRGKIYITMFWYEQTRSVGGKEKPGSGRVTAEINLTVHPSFPLNRTVHVTH